MSKKIEFEHGGVRVNAGRKAQFSEPTKVIRVPESQVDFIKNWLLNNVKTDIRSDLSSSLKVHNVQAKNDRVYRIPLATERVAAGAASPAQSHVDQALDLNEYLIRNEKALAIYSALILLTKQTERHLANKNTLADLFLWCQFKHPPPAKTINCLDWVIPYSTPKITLTVTETSCSPICMGVGTLAPTAPFSRLISG